MKLTKEALACLQLSLLTEAGDPRLVGLLRGSCAVDLINSLKAGSLGRAPASWTRQVGDIEERSILLASRASASGLRWITAADRSWPHQLDDLDHIDPINGATGAPLGLWLRGRANLATLCGSAVAVVGARDATTYGCEVAADIAADLADSNVTVVSGAAAGIDACAHRGAMAMAGPTVAVLAGGVDVNYPRANSALLDRIAATCVVVSEQAPGQAPLKQRFLSRNRIIAALTGGTLVVEAARRSGSLNTLNWADQLGRVTMGVPGPVTSQASAGVHEALRTGKAMVVTNGREIIEAVGALGVADATPLRAPESAFDRLPGLAQRILDSLPWGTARSLDEISLIVGADPETVGEHLGKLSRLGLVNAHEEGWSLQRRADLLSGH